MPGQPHIPAPGDRIGLGRTAEVFAYPPGQDGLPRIVKLFDADYPRTSVEFEYNMTHRLYAAGLPVPRVDDLITHFGRDGIVFERVNGVMLGDYLERHFWRAGYVGRVMGGLHAQLHTVELAGLPSVREHLRWNIEHAPAALPDQARTQALAMLDALPDENTINHGDFHVENIILTPQRAVVIDWVTVTAGAPLADVARTALLMKIGVSPDPPPALLRLIERRVRARVVESYLETYFALTGTSRADLQAIMLPVAAARFRESIPDELPARLRVIEALLNGKTGLF